jgi:hypothetical protein
MNQDSADVHRTAFPSLDGVFLPSTGNTRFDADQATPCGAAKSLIALPLGKEKPMTAQLGATPAIARITQVIFSGIATASEVAEVKIRDYKFVPQKISLKAGTTMR